MRRLLTPIVLFPTALIFLVLAAIWLGRHQPPSEWIDVLHLTDCELPCWLDITPGETSIDRAQEQVEAVFGDRSHYRLYQPTHDKLSYIITYKQSGYSLNIQLQGHDALVDAIWLGWDHPSSALPSIASLYPALGAPFGIYAQGAGEGQSWTTVLFHVGQVRAPLGQMDCGKVQVDGAMHTLYLYRQRFERGSDWRGFSRANGACEV